MAILRKLTSYGSLVVIAQERFLCRIGLGNQYYDKSASTLMCSCEISHLDVT
jgi:hypothetical protein